MKICQAHWDSLRAAIKERGLDHLGAKNGEEAVERMQDELNGVATDDTYDPLMSANWMISSNALQAGGLYLMGADEKGEQYCPLCEVEKHIGVGTAAEWIQGCTDSIRQHCIEKGLIAKPS